MNEALTPCVSSVKPTDPPAPPKLRVTIFPFAWQVLISEASDEQSGRVVPGKVVLSLGLHVCVSWSVND